MPQWRSYRLGRPKIDGATERKVRKQLAKGVRILRWRGRSGSGLARPIASQTSLAESQHCHFAFVAELFMCGPPVGGLFGFKFSSRPHPRKFGQKRFLAVRRSWRGNGGGLFWATSLEKIFGGVIAIISLRPGGWMQQSAVPRCAILSVGSTGGIGQ